MINRVPVLCLCLLSAFGCADDESRTPSRAVATDGAVRTPVEDGGSSSTYVLDASADPARAGDRSRLDAEVHGPSDPPVLFPPVACGSVTCTLLPGLPSRNPCCVDPAQGTCGKESTRGKCVVPPKPDVRCPTVGDNMGCCSAEGMCGLDVSVFGFGCQELGDETLIKFTPNVPAARRCDAEPVPDAGSV